MAVEPFIDPLDEAFISMPLPVVAEEFMDPVALIEPLLPMLEFRFELFWVLRSVPVVPVSVPLPWL